MLHYGVDKSDVWLLHGASSTQSGSYYMKRKLHLILHIYIQLTNIKLDKPYQTYQ